LVVGIIAIMLLEGVPGAVAGVPSVSDALPGSSSAADAAQSVAAAAALSAASDSLANGSGPAGGVPYACAFADAADQATCSAATANLPGNIGSQKWESEVAPTARTSSVMTYDAKDRYVLMFGGYNGTTYLADTWEFAHNMWVQLAPANHPSPRANASMTYDAKDSYVVLFGGYNGKVLSDTWKYVGGAWTQLSPATSPPARKDATMSYDTADGYVVMFGGSSGTAALGDTWKFVGGAWTQLSPTTSPSARWGSTSTFDTADNVVLLFGGYTGASFLGDTWEFVGGQWTQLSPATSPSPRYESGMTYEATTGYVLLFGGASRTGSTWTALGDTWSFKAGTWKQIVPSPGVHTTGGKALPFSSPAARQSFTIAYSAQSLNVVVFGGIVDGDPIAATPSPNTQTFGPTDTWTYTSSGWAQVQSEADSEWAQLPGRVGAGIAYDPTAQFKLGSKAGTDGYTVAFGGFTAYGPNAETWVFMSQPSAVWSETFPVTSPSARAYMAMAYDAKDGYVLLFGGMNAAGTALGDTWTFQSGNWTQLSPSTSPSARYGAMMTYDQTDGYILLFGGTNGATYFSDTWSFTGGTWTQVPNTSGGPVPSARAFGGIGWDSSESYTVLFGGTTGSAALNDTWKYVGGSWTQFKTKGATPAPEWGMTMLYDGKSSNVFLFGGCTTATVNPLAPSCPSADTQGTPWQFKTSWTLIPWHARLTAIPAEPQARFLAAGVYDVYAPTEVVLLFDGITSSGVYASDRWVFQSNIFNPWSPPVLPEPRYGSASTFDDRSQDMLMFGGIGPVSGGGNGYLDDTWQWDTGAWGEDNPTSSPSARAFSGIAFAGTIPRLSKPGTYDATVLFGGIGPSGYLGDTWKWVGSPAGPTGGGTWTQVHPTTAPSARSNVSMTYDAADNEIVLFGGQNSGGYLGDTWVFSASGQWSELFPSVSPSARAGAAMVYDSEDGYVVLFGGVNNGGALSDTWKFLGGTWTQLSPSSSPSARYGAAIIDCPQLSGNSETEPDVVLLFGGTNGATFDGDTWAFSGGQWTLLPTTTPDLVPFAFGAVSNDIDDGHPSIFGGLTAGGPIGDFWEFKLGS
jgi:hypothetical protein